jgi:hypothetical protein
VIKADDKTLMERVPGKGRCKREKVGGLVKA